MYYTTLYCILPNHFAVPAVPTYHCRRNTSKNIDSQKVQKKNCRNSSAGLAMKTRSSQAAHMKQAKRDSHNE